MDLVCSLLTAFLVLLSFFFFSSSLLLYSIFPLTGVNKAMTDLGLVGSNVFASYIYIVHKGLIRWKAVGMATDTELNTLKLVVHKLLGGTLKPPSSSPPSSSPPPPPSTPQNKPASHGKTV